MTDNNTGSIDMSDKTEAISRLVRVKAMMEALKAEEAQLRAELGETPCELSCEEGRILIGERRVPRYEEQGLYAQVKAFGFDPSRFGEARIKPNKALFGSLTEAERIVLDNHTTEQVVSTYKITPDASVVVEARQAVEVALKA